MAWQKRFIEGVTFNCLYLMRQELGFLLDADSIDDTQLTLEERDKLERMYWDLNPIVERLSKAGRSK